jgi:hypothetical protein
MAWTIVPLGIDRRVPEERMRLVLDGITPRNVKFFGVDLDGIQLRADDLLGGVLAAK